MGLGFESERFVSLEKDKKTRGNGDKENRAHLAIRSSG
jgi:hypothetical protein